MRKPAGLTLSLLRRALLVGAGVWLIAFAAPSAAPTQAQAPTCTGVCGKSGVNYATAVRQPMGEYLRAQQLGMGWVLEIAFHPDDALRTAEAINRAHQHNLEIIIRICAGQTCEFSDPAVYAEFLHTVAERVDGYFWAVLGPNEPELEQWAGTPEELAAYMNAVLTLTESIDNLRTLSPIFNVSNQVTHNYFQRMENAGARFSDLDGFTGTSYTISGRGAYYYYASHTGHAETMRQKAIRYDKPFIFSEYGTFGMFGKPQVEGDPARQPILQEMQREFQRAAEDPTVAGILHFDAFGLHGTPHRLFDSEVITVTRVGGCAGGPQHLVGVGQTTETTLWQLNGESTCREIAYGCPFNNGVPCTTTCTDNDGDGLCASVDCDDRDDTIGEACGGAPTNAEWGIVRPVTYSVARDGSPAWPRVVVRGDGTPLIAYHDALNGGRDLFVLNCTTSDCSTATRRAVETANEVGLWPALALRGNGLPVIAHFDATDQDLELFACSDTACTSGENRILNLDTGFFSFASSIAMRPDGRPIIAYWHSDFQDLHAYDCADPACSDGAVRVLAAENQVGYAPSVIMQSSGLPLITHTAQDLGEVRLFRCNNGSCTAGTSDAVAWGAQGFTPQGVTLWDDGSPALLFQLEGENRLRLLNCLDPHCDTLTRHTLTEGRIRGASIITLPNDMLLIAALVHESVGGQDLRLILCADRACEHLQTTTHAPSDVVGSPSIALTPGGTPLIAYHDRREGAVILYEVLPGLINGTEDPPDLPPPPPAELAQNGGFEAPLSHWSLLSAGGMRLCNRPEAGVIYSDSGDCMAVLLGAGGANGLRYPLALETWGSPGTTYQLSYRARGLNVPPEALIGSRMIASSSLTGESQVVTCLLDTPIASGTFDYMDAACTFTTDITYDSLVVLIGWVDATNGYLGIDNVSLITP